MPGERVTSFMMVAKLPKASLTRVFWKATTARELTELVEMTNISARAKATRWRSWSGAVRVACHHSDCAQGTRLLVHAVGGVAAMSARVVGCAANCSLR